MKLTQTRLQSVLKTGQRLPAVLALFIVLLALGSASAARAQFAFDAPTGTTFTVHPGDTLTFHGTLNNNQGFELDDVSILPTFTGVNGGNFTFVYPQHLILGYPYNFHIYDTNSNNTLTIKVKSGATPGNYAFYFDANAQGDGNGNFTGDIYSDNYIISVQSSAAAPTLTSFAPTSGPVGTSVTLTGTGFTGASSVAFNGTSAPGYTINSDTQITVAVPTGATTGTIAVTTPGGTATSTSSFTVTPPPVTISSVAFNPSTVTGGANTTGTLTLTGPAPAGNAVVHLTSSNTAALYVPATAQISAGLTSRTFTAVSHNVSAPTTVTVTATYSGVSVTTTVTVNPAPVYIGSVAFNPPALQGGANTTGTLTLTGPAPAGNAVVQLTSSNPAALYVPATAQIGAGLASRTFTAVSHPVTAITTVTVTATYNGVSVTTTVTINPAPVSMKSVSFNPSTVTGGANTTGTLTLTGPAPAGNAVVQLTSSNPAALYVPATAQINVGLTSRTFTGVSHHVTAATTVTVTATYNGVSATATVTVTP